jgi:hypothetical protein
MEVIGDETLMIVGLPEPTGIIAFIGEPIIPGLGCVGSWNWADGIRGDATVVGRTRGDATLTGCCCVIIGCGDGNETGDNIEAGAVVAGVAVTVAGGMSYF